MESTDSESWLGAMRTELKSMDDKQVWNFVDLPDGVRVVECKCVFDDVETPSAECYVSGVFSPQG
jgi:hypothetical protein